MTNAELIAEARAWHQGDCPSNDCQLIYELGRALEASEAQVARLRMVLNVALDVLTDVRRSGDYDVAEIDTICVDGQQALDEAKLPADLLEAVQALYYGADHEHIYDVAMCSLCKAHATLVRYGLLEVEHARNA